MVSNPYVGVKRCAQPGCENTLKDTAWSIIKTPGWFHQKNGDSWCPDHIPEWVVAWRAKKRGDYNGS